MSNWVVHKFGGTSLADSTRIRNAADLMLAEKSSAVGVVVSAMGGMTDALLKLSELAEEADKQYETELDNIGERYRSAAAALLEGEALDELQAAWQRDAADIVDVLNAAALVNSAPQRSRDVVAGYGEIWSARLLTAVLGASSVNARMVDARELITVNETDLGPTVVWPASQQAASELLPADLEGIAVITGFIASDEDGLQTTLGRNGSDFSAAICASLTDAKRLTIWTDVDGIMSADPRRVPDATVIDQMTYNEAMELAYFGASVIHPQTLAPVVDKNIPLRIRNSLNPEHGGSEICAAATRSGGVKGITAIGGMALINLEGAGMIGVPGTAERLFRSLNAAGVSVTLISQASSEHSICIAVPGAVANHACEVIRDAFADELKSGQIQSVDVTSDQSIVAVVGDEMAGTPGLAAQFFRTLGRAGINVRAIAQGSSERNISAVVDSSNATRALRASHSGFYLSAKTLSIGLIGPGSVGATLLEQLRHQSDRLRREFNIDLRIRAIARSSTMLLGERTLDLDSWRGDFDEAALPLDFESFQDHTNADHLPHAAVIDCTASESVAERYCDWLKRGIHVVTPNKKAFSGSLENYDELRRSAETGSSHYFYETTVGAALPVIQTLRDLVNTGDRIRQVQGILSGTLAYLFNVYDGSKPFSAIVRQARDSGYTEPDPRDDLSGMDVARKLTILGREMGHRITIGEFPVENLVPQELRGGSIDEFLDGLERYDDEFAERYAMAQQDGKALRYIAQLDSTGDASVSLQAIDSTHAFRHMNLTDNVIQFSTDRYSENPLVVKGPGAGPEVTAAGVFGDVLRLAAYLSKEG